MNICVAHADQSDVLAAVHAQAFERPWAASEIAALLQTPGVIALLADEEPPAGIVLCRTVADEAEILTLAVAPWARRQGVARGLVLAAQDLVRRAGAEALLLEVGATNTAAITLYGGLGFIAAGRRKAYYDRSPGACEDALVMRLDLTPQAR